MNYYKNISMEYGKKIGKFMDEKMIEDISDSLVFHENNNETFGEAKERIITNYIYNYDTTKIFLQNILKEGIINEEIYNSEINDFTLILSKLFVGLCGKCGECERCIIRKIERENMEYLESQKELIIAINNCDYDDEMKISKYNLL